MQKNKMGVRAMAGRRICAGYYRRYDGKTVYVISTATDADTGKEIVIWTAYPFADVPKYYTSSKKSFCAFVEVNGERKAKYKRLMNMKISEAVIEGWKTRASGGQCGKSRDGSWRKNTTPANISSLSPTSHTPRTCARTITLTGANIASA